MNQMNIELSKMQLIHLRNICKKGWGGYSEPNAFLDEMVVNGLLTRKPGPFGDVVYRPTKKGNEYIDLKK
jgi:hypothetical protein